MGSGSSQVPSWFKEKKIVLINKTFVKNQGYFSGIYLFFAVSKTYRTVTPLYTIEPNHEFCERHTPNIYGIYIVKKMQCFCTFDDFIQFI